VWCDSHEYEGCGEAATGGSASVTFSGVFCAEKNLINGRARHEFSDNDKLHLENNKLHLESSKQGCYYISV